MEAHMVHYKRLYGSYVNASKEMDGLAIVAIFFMVSGEFIITVWIKNYNLLKVNAI